jgi:2-methylcitrate dehydratase PrpD
VAAIVLVRGRAGPGEYNADVLTDPTIEYLRRLIELAGDPSVDAESGALNARLRDGRDIDIKVDHATGTIYRPMSDADLRRKLHDAAAGVLDPERVDKLTAALEHVQESDNVASIMELAAT